MNTDQLMARKSSNFTRGFMTFIALWISFVQPQPSYAQSEENSQQSNQSGRPLSAEETFTLDFNNIDLHALIEIVSIQTGKTFIVDPTVKANVNFISSEPVSGDKLYELFLSVLQVHGFAAVDVGAFTKIVPTQTGVQSPTPLLNQQSEPRFETEKQIPDDELVTQVIRLQGMHATDVVSVLSPLLSQSESINAEPTSNSVVITARKANIEKLIDLIRQMAGQ